jgi:hypothetical protein
MYTAQCDAVLCQSLRRTGLNGTERDRRQRERGGKLPGPIAFESVALGEGENPVDDEVPEGDGWVEVAMKGSTESAAKGQLSRAGFVCQ